jgi:hypothetical protein
MSPADDWKPLSFFFAIPVRIKGRYKYYCPRGCVRVIWELDAQRPFIDM